MEILGTHFIEELLALVGRGEADTGAQLAAECDRLRTEVERLVTSIAAGVPPASVAPLIRRNETEIARLEAQRRAPRPAPPNIERLREALTLRAWQWQAELRAASTLARLILRRLIGPLVLWDESTPPAWVRWEAPATAGLLDGLITSGWRPQGQPHDCGRSTARA